MVDFMKRGIETQRVILLLKWYSRCHIYNEMKDSLKTGFLYFLLLIKGVLDLDVFVQVAHCHYLRNYSKSVCGSLVVLILANGMATNWSVF